MASFVFCFGANLVVHANGVHHFGDIVRVVMGLRGVLADVLPGC